MLRLPWRTRALDPDASYAVLIAHGLAYGRIPKAANSLVRRRMVRAAKLPPIAEPNRDATWADPAWPGTAMLTGRALAAQHPDAYVFTVVRDPFARLVSCWRNKVVEVGAAGLPRPFHGAMPFADFVAAVADVPDRRADVHFRAQTALLFAGGRPPRLEVFRLEQLSADWERLRAAWTAHGLDLGPQRPHVPKTKRVPAPWTARAVELARERYADDFATFYPEAPDPPLG